MNESTHVSEYHAPMVALLEWLWGRDFLAPGGEGNVRKMVAGLDLAGQRVLDIGCGLGGPAFVLAREFGARVTGIDFEKQLVERAAARAVELGLAGQTDFVAVKPGPLPFGDESFDVIFTSGALTQTEDKARIFSECLRVLKRGGVLTCYEWLKSEGDLSPDMQYFIRMEELTYNLVTLEELGRALEDAGFEGVSLEDASAWYRRESRREYELLRGEGYGEILRLIGKSDADHLVEDWRSLVVVCEKGELRQGYTRARKPS
jgi:ubiquinone/menaquinone biosynthesis C-methylase UbiE